MPNFSENLKTKKKICFFSPSSYEIFFDTQKVSHGGAEVQMCLLAKEISKNEDFTVQFIVGDYNQKKTFVSENIIFRKAFNLSQNEIFFGKIKKAIKLFFILSKLKPDTIITTTSNSIAGLVAFYAKIFGKKHIHRTSHTFEVSGEWIAENGIAGKIYKYGLENASAVVTQNQEHKNLLKQNHNIDAVLLKNSFDLSSKKNVEKKHILWVGRFEKWKNPQLCIKLAQLLPNLNFVMICPFEGNDFKAWQALQKQANNLPNITFKAKVHYTKIQKYFDEAKIFVNTSDYEGFPNTFLQSAFGETPIVSLTVNPDNFLTKHNCGEICNNNFDLLVKKVKFLSEKENLRKKYGQNLFKYLEENHDLKKNVKIIEKQIEN